MGPDFTGFRTPDTIRRGADRCHRHKAKRIARSLAIFIPLLLLSTAPVVRSQNPPSASDQKDQKVDKEFYTPKDRIAAMQAASIFVPKAVGDTNILQGPPQDPKQFQFHPNDKVYCDFDKPGSQMGGKTPKFSCKIAKVESPGGQVQALTPQMDEEAVKVKYGSGDNEIYAEVVSTRLMWALGFYADSWFPVHVECNNCPADPESGSGDKGTRSYDAATIVRKYSGHKMYEEGKGEQGWSWKEFEQYNGRPNSEKDGLILLAAFIQHSDNKPPQQRLVCDGVKVDQSTHPFTTTCKDSKMIVQDVGATFGSGGAFTSNDAAKMNLENWSGKHLWKKTGKPGMSEADCPVCQAQLSKSLTAKDGLGDPTVSEEGRRFLAGLMCQLSDAQIEDLFKAAQVASMPKYRNSDGSFKQGLDEATIDKQWVEAFKAKREELASGRCRWKNKPADLAPIDNPMGLSTVPNHCTAPPH
ncbi:MAG: hypothetical protein WBL63_11835 [Candidatus Acidiferrum sp.]